MRRWHACFGTTRLILCRCSSALGASVFAALCMGGLSCSALLARLTFAESVSGQRFEISVGDGLLWLFLGHPQGLVIEWVAPIALSLGASFFVAAQLCGDGLSFGCALTGSRHLFWRSFCLAACVATLLVGISLMVSMSCFVLLAGGRFSLSPLFVLNHIPGVPLDFIFTDRVVSFAVLVLVELVACAIVQTVAALLLGAALGYISVLSIVLATGTVASSAAFGSWMMAEKVIPLSIADRYLIIDYMIITITAAIIAMRCGECIFEKRDIGPKTKRW